MKPAARPLDSLLYTLLIIEPCSYAAYFLSPSQMWGEEDNSASGHFWQGIWYVLIAWWLVSMALSFANHRASSYLYRWNWGAFFLYTGLSRQYPTLETAFGQTMGDLNTFLGGACCLLLWMRFRGIGEWSQESLAALIKRRWFGWSPPAADLGEAASDKAGTEACSAENEHVAAVPPASAAS